MRPDLLHVVAVYSNPRRYLSREQLARLFIAHMIASGVRLTFVEHAFGERAFAFDPVQAVRGGWTLVQVRGGANQELWIKEALQKVGIRHLPANWEYLALIDADITFAKADWASETVHMLQHHRLGRTGRTRSIWARTARSCAMSGATTLTGPLLQPGRPATSR